MTEAAQSDILAGIYRRVGKTNELLATFDSELRAGEVPANKGATLNARLSAREAVGV